MKASPEWTDRLVTNVSNLGHQPIQRQNMTPADYEQKKFLAVKALQNMPNTNEVRIPTSVWSGYGFSLTSPSSMLSGKEFLTSATVSENKA